VDTPPLLQYPCDYPIKVMARASPELRATLDPILARHGGPAALANVTERPSKQAHFVGVTYVIRAHGEAQIAALFAELKTCPAVLMVI
jgi:putative lipoic acid-binding regulatory protein